MRMIGKAMKDHPVITTAAGATIGYSAASGNPWMILAALGSWAAYLQASKMTKAREAARLAAIETGTHDPNCIADLSSPECIQHAKSAAIAAGLAVMSGHGELAFVKKVLIVLGALALLVVIFNALRGLT
jgi:hypothetical protein